MLNTFSSLKSFTSPFGQVRVFKPSFLFTANEVGAWYDPSDLTTLFQDLLGTIPLTTPGQSPAVMLDKSKGMPFAPRRNLYKDSQNLASASWITNRATTTAAGTISTPRGNLPYFKVTATGTDPQLTQSVDTGPIAGKTYTLSFVAWTDAGQPTDAALFFFGGNTTEQVKQLNLTLTTTPTLYTLTGSFTGGATNTIVTARIDGSETQGGYIYATAAQFEPGSSVTAYQETTTYPVSWLGNHASQATSAQRPTYGIHPYSGVRNVANGSASTANSTFWPTGLSNNGITATKVGSGTDTDGLPYADYSVVGTAIGLSRIFLTAMRSPAINGQTYTGSISFKLMSGTAPAATNGPFPAVIAETAPTTYVANSPFSGIPPTATETIRSVTYTLANAAINQINSSIIIDTQPAVSVNYTVRMKALQFELGSTRTAYQANFSQYNITEAGVPSVHYIGFDGVDDGMVTSAIDFSATDAVTVFAGVRKLSDAARAMLYELGPTTATASIRLEAPNTPAVGQYVTYSNGSLSGASANTNAASAPITSVMASVSKISTDTLLLRLNGTQVASSATDQGTGNYAANQLYIGRRGGVALPFNGNIYSLIVRGAQSTAGQITNTETWVNGKTGAY